MYFIFYTSNEMANYINYTYLTPLSGCFKEKSREYRVRYKIRHTKIQIILLISRSGVSEIVRFVMSGLS